LLPPAGGGRLQLSESAAEESVVWHSFTRELQCVRALALIVRLAAAILELGRRRPYGGMDYVR
jgi:hypothetical protein